jgi:hypothetical protein
VREITSQLQMYVIIFPLLLFHNFLTLPSVKTTSSFGKTRILSSMCCCLFGLVEYHIFPRRCWRKPVQASAKGGSGCSSQGSPHCIQTKEAQDYICGSTETAPHSDVYEPTTRGTSTTSKTTAATRTRRKRRIQQTYTTRRTVDKCAIGCGGGHRHHTSSWIRLLFI